MSTRKTIPGLIFMFKPVDIICSHPKHLDYPLWRQQIHRDRAMFDRVIVVFTDMSVNSDERIFIQEAMKHDDVNFMNSERAQSGEDWRNKAVNLALSFSKSEWVLFTEQDFIITNPQAFWEKINNNIKNRNLDVISFTEGNRPHPAFMLVKRKYIDKTNKNFGVVPDKHDHFYKFFDDLLHTNAQVGYFSKTDDFYHLNGLSQNMYLLQTGQKPNFRPEEFKKYLQNCLAVEVPIQPEFNKIALKYINANIL